MPNEAKGSPKERQESSKASQRDPKDSPGIQKGVQRKTIYTKTPDQPHRRPLCFNKGSPGGVFPLTVVALGF